MILSECRFDAFLDQEQHSQQVKIPEKDPMKFQSNRTISNLTASISSTPSSGDNWENRADQLMHEVDNLQDLDPRELKTNRKIGTSFPPSNFQSTISSTRSFLIPYHDDHSMKFDPDGDEITNVSVIVSVYVHNMTHPSNS